MNTLMTNVYWVLGKKQYRSYDDFIADVTDYNQKIDPTKTKWSPDKQITNGPIKVVYEAMWRDEDDKIEVQIGEPRQPLTMGQILFTLNNATLEFFRNADHCFFEGITSLDDDEYEIMVGS